MVTFNSGKTDQGAVFDYQLARLIALVDDMKEIRSGVSPERFAADPPILERWMLANRPVPCLAGLSFGHPLLPGEARPVATSDLCLLADDQTWARTLSRWYRLGRPAESPIGDS
jgi:hypothetical protein